MFYGENLFCRQSRKTCETGLVSRVSHVFTNVYQKLSEGLPPEPTSPSARRGRRPRSVPAAELPAGNRQPGLAAGMPSPLEQSCSFVRSFVVRDFYLSIPPKFALFVAARAIIKFSDTTRDTASGHRFLRGFASAGE